MNKKIIAASVVVILASVTLINIRPQLSETSEGLYLQKTQEGNLTASTSEFKKEIPKAVDVLTEKAKGPADYTPVTEQEKDLKRSRFISGKALKSQADIEKMQDMYSDKEQIKYVVDVLQAKDETSYMDQNIIKRLDAVSFMADAIKWKANPESTYILDQIRDLVVNFSTHGSTSPDLNRSVAGDRIELYKALLEHRPNFAVQIEKEAELSASTKTLMKFTKDFYFNNKKGS